ncbi:type II toxin-antitoxin system HicA family toxin [Vibrio spartinae]|uniref:YcfA-like protein n=1 Tax=Vibrio spartinae TaxID=1918945 RepID=A0A1N6LZR6_9VIBR|nr:type II toxin-antitoxin system HicA family toxin [Vibrio spartinae]QMV16825.1 YcfA-like protein [Vibrio spartinae]SIO92617.1 YcfA-like protein [Vibrio spartinae]
MKSADLINLLKKNGWELVSVRGSHHKFRHPAHDDPIIVPHPKKDLKIGLVNKIKRQAGL